MENKTVTKQGFANKLSKDTKKSMLTRIITSLMLGAIAIPAFIFGDWFFIVFTVIVLVLATKEAISAAKNSRSYIILYILAYLAVFALSFWIFVKNNMNYLLTQNISIWDFTKWQFHTEFKTLEVSTLLITIILIVLFIFVIFDRKLHFELATYLFMMVILLGLSFQSFTYLRFFPRQVDVKGFHSAFLLIYVILGAIFNDIGAYFIGVLFGKHKMAPKLSPKKTWEGFAGGYVISFLISFGFAMIVSLAGNPMIPLLSHSKWYLILAISLVMPLLANIGDLFFSALKRNFEIKDYGSMLKGHGGVLDRIDSILVVCLGVSTIVILMNNNWNLLNY